MDKALLLVLCLAMLSNVQLGSQSNGMSVSLCSYRAIIVLFAAAGHGFESLPLALDGLKEDMKSIQSAISTMRSEIANLSTRVSQLAKELEEHKNSTEYIIAHLESSLQSAIGCQPTDPESKYLGVHLTLVL